MKRLVLVELVAAAALLALGCGGGTETSTSTGGGWPDGWTTSTGSSVSGAGGASAATSTSSTSSAGTGGAGGAVEPSPAVQTEHQLGSTTATFGFYDYLPPGYNDGKSRPLMVFFHGLGENGNGTTDLVNVLKNGPPKLIDQGKWPADRPFVVISAQWNGNGNCPSAEFIHEVIGWSVASYHIDAKRVYLTGLSCGAIGGWGYLGQYTDTEVAAAVLISGAGKGAFNQQGCALTKTAIWAFHGDKDTTVLPDEDELVMPKLIACPQPRRDQQFTLYPGVGHDAWSQTFDLSAGHDVYAWLLANPKP
jgi:predicted peptidase